MFDIYVICPYNAAPNSQFTHIAINPNTENGVVVWMERVTDEEYKKYKL